MEVLDVDPLLPEQRSFLGALERPGRYQLTVEAEGYAPVVKENINVGRTGRCNTVRFTAIDVSMTSRH